MDEHCEAVSRLSSSASVSMLSNKIVPRRNGRSTVSVWSCLQTLARGWWDGGDWVVRFLRKVLYGKDMVVKPCLEKRICWLV